jgi:hypothetical protein
MADMKGILDFIRSTASTEYQERVPVATQTNIAEIGNPIMTYQSTQNEFLTGLINRIGLAIITNKIASNPLAVLKKGSIPLGSDIQQIFTNMARDSGYDGSGAKLLTKTTPDVKALYHRVNREGQYAVTITKPMLQRAFTSYGELENMLTSIINSMYSGDNFDEFVLTKNLFASAIEDDKIVKVAVSHVNNEATGKAFVKAVKNASSAFTFPSSAFNKYYANKPTHDNGDPVVTWTPHEDQIFIVRADIMNEVDVEVLASAFNVDKVKFLAQTLVVDSFGSATNCLAILADKSWTQVYDNLYEITEFYNAQGLYWNYWLNHWQTYGVSLFANAVAIMCDDEAISLNNSTLSFTTTATQTLVATTTPADAEVAWFTTHPDIATVSSLGVVTPVADGIAIITAVNGDKTASCVVTVNLP